jgi:hypothetical protein
MKRYSIFLAWRCGDWPGAGVALVAGIVLLIIAAISLNLCGHLWLERRAVGLRPDVWWWAGGAGCCREMPSLG